MFFILAPGIEQAASGIKTFNPYLGVSLKVQFSYWRVSKQCRMDAGKIIPPASWFKDKFDFVQEYRFSRAGGYVGSPQEPNNILAFD